MNRRDFLRLTVKGRERVLDLSCESLYVRYVDAEVEMGRRQASTRAEQDLGFWEGEPPTEITAPTTEEIFEELQQRLDAADVLRVHDRGWLTREDFRKELEARIDTFRRRGGRVEYPDPADVSLSGMEPARVRRR